MEVNGYLDDITRSLGFFWPELTLGVAVVLLATLAVIRPRPGIAQWTGIAGVVTFLVVLQFAPSQTDSLFDGMIRFFPSPAFRTIAAIATIVTLLVSKADHKEEYYLLIVSILLGADLLMISNHLLITLLAMELISLSSYVLTAGFAADRLRAEAAWKFFLFGSASTAIMIFGMSYLFGSTGSLLPGTAAFTESPAMFTIGCLMTMAGFLFKTTAAPFHVWAPDMYESTPAPLVAFISVVPKLAGLSLITHFIAQSNATALSVGIHLPNIVGVASILSMTVGTLAALAQTNIKRMMAYSSVAQAGFLLLAIASGSDSSLYFYGVVFAIMNYLVFVGIQEREETTGSLTFADFTGVGYREPILAIALTTALVSLTGLPPVAGFTAKLMVFSAAWSVFAKTGSGIFLTAFVVGLLATVASLFFYLKIPFHLYFRRPNENGATKTPLLTNLLLVILVTLLLGLFFAPAVLMG